MLEHPESFDYETVARKSKLKVKMSKIGQSAGKAPSRRTLRDYTIDTVLIENKGNRLTYS